MIDSIRLQYILKKHGIDRIALMREEKWSHTTYTRKVVSGRSSWTAEEISILLNLGIPGKEIDQIFFDRKLQK